MTDGNAGVSRRAVLRAAVGTAAAGAATGSATATEAEGEGGGGGGQPDFGGWLDDVDGGFTDARGESEVTVEVGVDGNGGAFAFAPAGLWVDSGTTVIWEWTGEGGAHNVHSQEGAEFNSGNPVAEAGTTFEHTFEEGGITTYQCDPHASLGMVGAVAVGDDVPTVAPGGGGGYVSILPDTAKTAAVVAVGGMASVLGLAYVFMKYGGPGDTTE